MTKQFFRDAFAWGFTIWLIGYILGILLFAFVPTNIIGWVIMPFGILLTLWVLFIKIKGNGFYYFLKVAVVWTLLAVICDYLFLVLLFKPKDGYYKLDVFVYYFLTFILPLIYSLRKRSAHT